MTEQYANCWNAALEMWSKYLKIKNPVLCTSGEAEKKEGLDGSFAMIRLVDHAVVVSTRILDTMKLQDHITTVFAHEIGHHIYCPGDMADQGRMIARMRRALPSRENLAPFIANLYSDLLINDHLQRDFGLPVEKIYEVIGGQSHDRMWTFYMRIYEILWGLTRGTLAKGEIDAVLEGDAQLGNRLVRSYARQWLKGAGRFAALCLSYLLQDKGNNTMQRVYRIWTDAKDLGVGSDCPDGLAEIEDGEAEDIQHPALDGMDPASDDGEDATGGKKNKKVPAQLDGKHGGSRGQYREPFEYGQILKDLGLKVSPDEIIIKYYKERAMPHLIPFPEKEIAQSVEPLLEGFETWEIGSPLESVDWFQTVTRSPYIVPGYTTVEQVYGTTVGDMPEKEPIDLDIYIDSSGSMPHPAYQVSYLSLAGAIIALSALRTGARVQATLWSGTRQFKTTKGFIRDEKAILGIITGYIGGSTAFPIHILRDTYKDRQNVPGTRAVHILVISDDGVTTMYGRDEKDNSGFEIAKTALEKARGGGTFVLNLYSGWERNAALRSAAKQGWDIYPVSSWEQLEKFAREFSRKKYGEKQ